MKRRAVIQSLLAVPAAACLPSEACAQQAKPAAPADRETPAVSTTLADAAAAPVVGTFNPAQISALRKLGDIMAPAAQGTPGAVACGAAEFLDFLIGASPAERVTLYCEGLDRLNREAQHRYGKPFGEIAAEQAEPILAPLHVPWSYRGPDDEFAKFLLAAKSDLLTATVDSREYIEVVSQRRRSAGGVGQYWYSVE